jgi:hypothetical protein
MIIWINGPFGIGKTQTAYELQRQIKGSLLFDPELIGYFLRNKIPRAYAKSDFQDYRVWRTTVSGILREMQGNPESIVIVPMTVVSEEYFKEIVEPLRSEGIHLRNYTLLARKETIQNRLTRRFDKHSWNYQQIDRCLEGLTNPIFEKFIDTDINGLYQVVEIICKDNGLPYKAPKNVFHAYLRRKMVLLTHIRIGR